MFKKNTVCYNNSRGDDTMAKEKKEKVTKKISYFRGNLYCCNYSGIISC